MLLRQFIRDICCRFVFLLPVIFAALTTASCKKDIILDDPAASLVFSTDTVLFDTIFTTIGSATRNFKVYNPHDRSVRISSINLAGGSGSPYRINVDGVPGTFFSDILVKPGDSLYVFAETTIDPLSVNSPMIVEDSLVFVTNGNIQDVKLISWGQDVNIIRGEVLETTVLLPDKPYLVYDFLLVDSAHTLTLPPGVRMHFSRNSRLYVAGTIIAEGDIDNPVVFEGARTESSYRNIPGQWEGILLLPGSSGNRFVNARIRNAINGIVAESAGNYEDTVLYISGSRIENMTYAGLLARESSIFSKNTIVANCGHYAIALTRGGKYEFYHCTIANYWRFSSRRTPSLLVENYFIDNDGSIRHNPLSTIFGNSIIDGSLSNEVRFSFKGDNGFDVDFTHSLLKTELNENSPANFTNCIFGSSPEFIDPSGYDLNLSDESPAIDSGDPEIGEMYPFDYEGKLRPFGEGPDMGALERHE